MNLILRFIILISLWLTAANAFSTSIEVSGNVSGVWNVDTVHVIGDLNIRESDGLVINPGVIVLFQGTYVFNVCGTFKSVGSADQMISFTMADTTGFYNDTIPDGGWKGIRYDNPAAWIDSSFFKYTRFSFGKAVSEDSLQRLGGAICIRGFSKIEISHCVFYFNKANEKGGAVYLKNADILLAYNEFDYNSSGEKIEPWGYGGAVCTDDGEPLILKNAFTNNLATGIGGALAVRFADCPVFFNTFSGNASAIGGAVAVLHVPACRHVISNNLIFGNHAVFFGGGVSNNNASPVWVNNTIALNTSESYGGAFYCKDSVNPKVYNSIIWGNQASVGSQVYLWETYAQASFYHCDIQEGAEGFEGGGSGGAYTGEYINNIDADPLFENIAEYHFNLTQESPCINTGMPDTTGLMIPPSDLAGNPRIYGNCIDMGAYEYPFPVGQDEQSHTPDVVFYPLYPNPSVGEIICSFYLLKPAEVNFKLINNQGQIVSEFAKQNYQRGKHEIGWKENIPAGTYLILLQAGSKIMKQKLVVSD